MAKLELDSGDLKVIRERIKTAYTGTIRVNELTALVDDVVPEVGGALPIGAGAHLLPILFTDQCLSKL